MPGIADSQVQLDFPADVMHVVPWVDPVVDALGFDPRSDYVELFWLGVIGPSTTWFMRRLAAGFDRSPEGFTLDLVDTARALGIGGQGGTLGGRNSPFARTLVRACQFGLAQPNGARLAVRRRLPPLNARQLERLPARLQTLHTTWPLPARETPDAAARRARHLALTLVELGESSDAVQAQLGRWRFAPDLCHAAARWAEHEKATRSLAPDAA
jgi:hypothetical protein